MQPQTIENEVATSAKHSAAHEVPAGLGRAALRSTAWIVASNLFLQMGRFAFNVALTRLLAPELFGLMALVNLFLQGLQMFSDLGIRQVVIASAQGEDSDFLDTAWTLQVGRGFLLTGAAAALSIPMAALYGQPDLLWLLPLTGLTTSFAGLEATAPWLLARRLIRGPLVLLEIGSYVVNVGTILAVIAIGEASRAADQPREHLCLVALAVGPLAAALFQLVVSHLLWPRRRHRLCWAPVPGRAIVRFGSWIFLSSACTFLAAQADRLVVGKLSLSLLGVYHIAAMLTAVPTLLLITLSSQVIFPVIARLLQAPQPTHATLRRMYWASAALAGLVISGLIATGPMAVAVIYDSRYQGAGPILQILAIGAWLTMLMATRERVLEAQARTACLAAAQGGKLAVLAVLLPLGLLFGGLPGIALCAVVAEAVRYAMVTYSVSGKGFPGLGLDFTVTAVVVVAAASGLAAPMLLGHEASNWLRLLVAATACVITWLPVTFILWHCDLLPRPELRRRPVLVMNEGVLEASA